MMKEYPETTMLDDVKYIRQDLISPQQDGNRFIAVLDKGFIFEGLLSTKEGVHTLSDCSNIRKWQKNGMGGLLKSATDSGATLDKSNDIKFTVGSVIFLSPTPKGWRE